MKACKMKVRALAPLVLILCLAFATQSAKAQSNFTYPPFTSGLQTNGDASIISPENSPNFLRLTPSAGGSVGSAWYFNPAGLTGDASAAPLAMAGGFMTMFTFQFSNPGMNGFGPADGLAFVIQNGSFTNNCTTTGDHTVCASGALAVGPHDGLGGELGFTGLTNSVAIHFDVYCNSEYGDVCSTPAYTAEGAIPFSSADAISVQSCGANANTTNHSTGCTFGTVDLSTLSGNKIYLADGNPHTAQIMYNPPPNPGGNGSCTPNSMANSGVCGSLTIMLDGQKVLTVPFSLSYLGLDSNADAFPGFTAATGGGFQNQDIQNWSFSSQTITQPVSTQAPTPFIFSDAEGSILNHVLDFHVASQAGVLQFPTGVTAAVQVASTNTTVDSATWPQYVAGGPLAPSKLFPLVENNPQNPTSGTNGGVFVDLCFDPTTNGTTATPLDQNCPSSTSNDPTQWLGINVTADLVSKQPIAPGTTTVLAHYQPPAATPSATWSPSTAPTNPACTATTGSVDGSQLDPTACNVFDVEQAIFGDQTTSSGKSRGKGTFAFAYGVPMLLSTVSVNGQPVNTPGVANPGSSALWFRSPLNLSFLVNPASMSTPTNNFQPAPVRSESYDIKQGGISIVGLTQASPSSPLNTSVAKAIAFMANQSLNDGQYTLEWSATDNIGIQEQNQQLVPAAAGQTTCPLPPGVTGPAPTVPPGGACYTTTLFSAQLNVDSTPPTITPTFTPASAGNIFAVGSAVQVHFGCADNLSGIATCQETGVAGLTDGGAVNTSSSQIGTHTFTITATDKAGNAAIPQTVTYQIVGSSELLLLNLAKTTVNSGSNLTYNVAVLNLGPSVADNVVVTDTLPTGTSLVSAGYGIVSCTLSGCSDLSGPGSACSISGTTVTCNIPTVGLLLKSFTGALVKITVKVNTTIAAGTVLSDTAMVKAVNTDPISIDNSATARTEVCTSTGSCPKLK